MVWIYLGYDVWLGNTRGNTYSKNHTYLDTCSSCPEFWSFGFDDSGEKDYSRTIDYILEITGQEKVHFVGHSMGTTQMMVRFLEININNNVQCPSIFTWNQFQVLLSERPEYNDKIHGAYLLAPPIYMTHASNLIFQLAQAAGSIEILFHLFGQYEFLPHSNIISWLGHFYCDTFQHPVLGSLCENIAFIIAGVDKTQLNT